VSAAVGRLPDDGASGEATMVVTADAPIPAEVVSGIVAGDGFLDGRTVDL
jgi:hypothetical protein